jgi:Flp pilus assembly pilin Flp
MEIGKNRIRRLVLEDQGTTFTEYGAVFVLIAMFVLLLALVAGGGALVMFQDVEPIG